MKRTIRYEPIRCASTLNAVKSPSMPFEWSINPYRGCQHGCSFCYARATHAFLGAETDDTFQNLIFVKQNAADALRRQLDRLFRSRRKGVSEVGSVAIGTATDPYQPIEATARVTRGCLEVLAEYPMPVSITTRSPLILRDIDLLKRISVRSINISIHTVNHAVWKHFEPTTPSPEKRLETVKRLAEEGLPVGVFLAPVLPYITDSRDELETIVANAAECRAAFVMASCLRLSRPEVKHWFFRTLEAYDPRLVKRYAALYHRSGYPPQSYRDAIRKTVAELLVRYGLSDTGPQPVRPAAVSPASDETVGKPRQLLLF